MTFANAQDSTSYAELVSRNTGFISDKLQESIRKTRVLVAGCGLGGVIAEVAVRTGFANLGVVDGDRVERHNLNRQMFAVHDIGCLKAASLAKRLRDVNPDAEIRDFNVMIDSENAKDLVAQFDLVIDTVDFRDPTAIRALHAEARAQGKTVIAPLAVGWGGAALVFSPESPSLEQLMGFDDCAADPAGHTEAFAKLMRLYASMLPDYALRVISRVLESKEICPFSQIGPGNFAVASLTVLLAVRLLAGEKVPRAPEMMLIDPMGCPVVCRPSMAA
jgi:molybdopterin/thiamine biosynthesis adenylyltransferase